MSEREAAVNLRFRCICGGEKFVDFFFGFDRAALFFLKFLRADVEILLDRHQNPRVSRCEFLHRHRFLCFDRLVTS